MTNRWIAMSVSVLVLSACTGVQRVARVTPITDASAQVISYPTELRGAYVLPDGARVRVCAEPAPDVALETLQRLTANLAGKASVSGGLSAEASERVVQLAGRTQLVLLARELLYRACELTINEVSGGTVSQAADGVAEKPNSVAEKLYGQVIELIRALGEAEQKDSEAKLTSVQNRARELDFQIKSLNYQMEKH